MSTHGHGQQQPQQMEHLSRHRSHDVINVDVEQWSKMSVRNRDEPSEDDSKLAQWGSTSSWIVNLLLLIVKIICVALSSSKAVAAALADSAVDLVSQGVLSLAENYMSKHHPDYPVGRSRLEALSVLASATIMIMASVEIIQYSAIEMYDVWALGQEPELEVDNLIYSLMTVGIGLKFVLWLFCSWASKILSSDLLGALSEDHFNDVISNTSAIVCIIIATQAKSVWWFDPVGAIVISLVIIGRWMSIMYDQLKKVVGHTAPPEFIAEVEQIAVEHDARLSVDCVRAYHFGARYNVEMEIVLPGEMTVFESHDLALALQHKIESLSEVERAFVHVDHQGRDGLEHKVERKLVRGDNNSTTSPIHQSNNNNNNNNNVTTTSREVNKSNDLFTSLLDGNNNASNKKALKEEEEEQQQEQEEESKVSRTATADFVDLEAETVSARKSFD